MSLFMAVAHSGPLAFVFNERAIQSDLLKPL